MNNDTRTVSNAQNLISTPLFRFRASHVGEHVKHYRTQNRDKREIQAGMLGWAQKNGTKVEQSDDETKWRTTSERNFSRAQPRTHKSCETFPKSFTLPSASLPMFIVGMMSFCFAVFVGSRSKHRVGGTWWVNSRLSRSLFAVCGALIAISTISRV